MTIHRIAEKGRDHLLFYYNNSTRSRTFRYLFITSLVRWLSRIFNRNAYVYHTATRWDFPPYWITIWLIDDAMFVCLFVCLLDHLILGFCHNLTLKTGGFELASTITFYFPLVIKSYVAPVSFYQKIDTKYRPGRMSV